MRLKSSRFLFSQLFHLERDQVTCGPKEFIYYHFGKTKICGQPKLSANTGLMKPTDSQIPTLPTQTQTAIEGQEREKSERALQTSATRECGEVRKQKHQIHFLIGRQADAILMPAEMVASQSDYTQFPLAPLPRSCCTLHIHSLSLFLSLFILLDTPFLHSRSLSHTPLHDVLVLHLFADRLDDAVASTTPTCWLLPSSSRAIFRLSCSRIDCHIHHLSGCCGKSGTGETIVVACLYQVYPFDGVNRHLPE
ncbi:unnamed protein product [Protopolystoma xenopodis]|uniref:Uncharacterized protein n=1 Tax=Protopolystoma xenopodis TaxID=117903 RepID=A0A448WNF6_9PLAT|nr:unnamed protein product [Protopolystoma xenopodis]